MKYSILMLISKILNFYFIKLNNSELFLIKGNNLSKGTFAEIYNLDNYAHYESNLYKNLDIKSKWLISLILKRIKKYLNSNKKIFLKTPTEIIKLKIASNKKNKLVKKEINGFSYGKYLLSRNHFNNGIFYDKYFIDEIKNKSLLRNKNIIDVGGFIGDSAVIFQDYTDKKIHVFEPVEKNYIDLLKTIKINKTNKIIPHKIGLGAETKECIINVCGTTAVGSTIRTDININKNVLFEKISILTLDKFIEETNLEVGLIKVDIEGLEQDFLNGAINTIKKQKPALIIAIYHLGMDFFTIKTQIENLNLGYRFKIRKATKNKILDDTVLIAEAFN